MAYIFAPAAVFLAPFLNFIAYQDYHPLRPEVLMAAGVVLLAGILLGAVMALRPATLGQILLVAAVIAALDMSLPAFSLRALARPSLAPWPTLAWHWAVVVGLLVATRLFYRHVSTIVLILFSVVCVTAVLFPTAREARGVTLDRAVPADAAEVPILHLVLDEFIGIEGIPSDIPGGADLRDELKRFFVENGFRLYGGAYSQTSETQHAMAALLNGQPFPSQRTAFEEGDGRTSWRLPRNLWFERLAAKGYAIQVYDNSWLGYCAPENRQIERCYLAPSNSIKFMERLKIPAWDKARVILSAYLELSSMSTFLGEVANLPIYRLGALASGDIFDDLARAIGNTDHGRLFFAHLLSPHYSYVYEPGCQVKPDSRSWTNRRLPFRGRDEEINTPRSRAERYVAYFAQVRCVKRQLQGLFGELRAAGRYDDLTIILHGDHGSRLAIWDPIAAHGYRLSDRDVIDSFSTLYAVKKPGLRPGYDATVRSIQGLFAEMFLGTPLRPNLGDVVLRGTQRLDEDFGAAERFRRFPADGF